MISFEQTKLKTNLNHTSWQGQLRLVSWSVVSGAAIALSGTCTLAQPIPDATLPNNSFVTSEGNIILIERGTQSGTNLFHSFTQFDIPTENTAHFDNALMIDNILVRVTGEFASNIDGTLKTNGTANLFLINPNGIIFGPHASLNIGGSFVASTASSIKFADGTEFSATTPQSEPLLTVSVPIGLQFGENSRSILNQSRKTDNRSQLVGLQVNSERTLALVGGEVELDGGILNAPDGRIELGSVGSYGLVSLTSIATGYVLNYQGINDFQHINLGQGASVKTSGNSGGSISIQGERVTLTQNSTISADTFGNLNGGGIIIKAKQFHLESGASISALTFGAGNSGKLAIHATDSVELVGTGFEQLQETFIIPIAERTFNLFNLKGLLTGSYSAGAAGNITIDTRRLSLDNGAVVLTPTFGKGSGGNVEVNALELVEVISSTLSTITFGTAKAGDITIDTQRLSLRDGASVSTSTFFNNGDGGNLLITASDSVELLSTPSKAIVPTGLLTNTIGGVGKAGNIAINTKNLIARSGALVTSGSGAITRTGLIPEGGQGGNLIINATESIKLIGTSPSTQLIGTSTNTEFPSSLNTSTISSGKAGDLQIKTDQLIVQDGAIINTGPAVGINPSIVVLGDGGNLIIDALSVQLAGTSPGGGIQSGLYTETRSQGDAGDLKITTNRLVVQNGGVVSAATRGSGKGGNLTINASDSVQLIGTSSNRLGGLYTRTEGTGDGGDLSVSAPTLLIQDGAVISASTFSTSNFNGASGNITVRADLLKVTNGGQIQSTTTGTQDAGNITLQIKDEVDLAGADSGLFANTTSSSIGNGGSIFIDLDGTVTLQKGAQIAVNSQGTGQGGNIQLQAVNLILDNEATITAGTVSNTGGNINLVVTDLLLLRYGGQISTTARARGDGGNITINAPFIIAVPTENSDITANAFEGNGGNVRLTTQGIFGIEVREQETSLNDITASSQLGVQGTVEINNPNPTPTKVRLREVILDDGAEQIEQSFCRASQGSQFVVTGRGGVPPSPAQSLNSQDDAWEDLAVVQDRQGGSDSQVTSNSLPTSNEPPTIVEAQGWELAANGQVRLVAAPKSTTPNSSGLPSPNCQPFTPHS